MKSKTIVSALLIILLSIGISIHASARPGHWRGGFIAPRIGVRIGIPVPPVIVGGYYGGRYYNNTYACAPAPVYAPVVVGGYYGGGYYNHYNRGYYRGGGYRGNYGPRGGYRR